MNACRKFERCAEVFEKDQNAMGLAKTYFLKAELMVDKIKNFDPELQEELFRKEEMLADELLKSLQVAYETFVE